MSKRSLHVIKPDDLELFCRKLGQFASKQDLCTILDNHSGADYQYPTSTAFDLLIGVGSLRKIEPEHNTLTELYESWNSDRDWLMGTLGYDLKNEVERLESKNFDGLGFPDLLFYVPKFVFEVDTPHVKVHFHDSHRDELTQVIEQIEGESVQSETEKAQLTISPRISKDEYLEAIESIQQHIQVGDIYEANFCQEFYSEDATIEPYSLWRQLTNRSSMPFSAYFKFDEGHVICASPERYLRKRGQQLLSQPIKGTTKRSSNKVEDIHLARSLYESEKERSENVMIVDLVRNDLSHVAARGTVKVNELCGVYGFPMVYQMISSVSAELNDRLSWIDAIRTSFPMGSMTGAPKVMAMELMERYEKTKRGFYSGALGYVSPDGDFDFNVIIRSIQYNQSRKYLSFMVGGAITAKSDPEAEYQETLLKAKAIFSLFE